MTAPADQEIVEQTKRNDRLWRKAVVRQVHNLTVMASNPICDLIYQV
jgi:hypothetical protein